MTLQIAPMCSEDVPGSIDLIRRAHGPEYAQEARQDFLDAISGRTHAEYFVACTDGVVVGVAGYATIGWGVCRLRWVAVDERYRRIGIGRSVVEPCLDGAARIDAAVFLLTEEAAEFYASLGFEDHGSVRVYGSSCTLMWRRCPSDTQTTMRKSSITHQE